MDDPRDLYQVDPDKPTVSQESAIEDMRNNGAVYNNYCLFYKYHTRLKRIVIFDPIVGWIESKLIAGNELSLYKWYQTKLIKDAAPCDFNIEVDVQIPDSVLLSKSNKEYLISRLTSDISDLKHKMKDVETAHRHYVQLAASLTLKENMLIDIEPLPVKDEDGKEET